VPQVACLDGSEGELIFSSRLTRKIYTINNSANRIYHLRNFETVNGLISLLLQAWENVLLSDSSINLNNPTLKPGEKELLQSGHNPKFW